MILTIITPVALALILTTIQVSAQGSGIPCGANKLPPCAPEIEICVKPAPGGTCDPANLSRCPGRCLESCTLASPSPPCTFGQPCANLTFPTGDSTQGFCPEPAPCAGLAGTPCPDPQETCIDDPRDDCDSGKGAKDCSGICINRGNFPTDQTCGGFAGKKCPPGYNCADDSRDPCDPQKGDADCAGVCVAADPLPTKAGGDGGERGCDSKGLPPCRDQEICVHKPGCDGAVDCPGACTRSCGGFRVVDPGCPTGQTCVDNPDPYATCKGGLAADCPGVCQKA